jgi:Protein of unknown function (DUF1203)
MTTIANTTTWQVRPIPAAVLGKLRVADDAGDPPRLRTDAEGGSPLRCCLSASRPGELTALVSYAPLRRWARETGADPGPYDEVGPVFIHPGPCAGPSGERFPAAYLGAPRVLRAYAAGGTILSGRLAGPDELSDQASADRVLDEVLADPQVAVVHARALAAGCFTFEVRRT